ncbi:unnamed protein product [Porites lobata]|uniref:G-protein coupled receptors family 1 profile domain-containing protein n=1 Tax=Porites lobata TaxID=104759 RepID=A0ABN8RE33_9CNID|nr:unnamed protein product [Porites lobata]
MVLVVSLAGNSAIGVIVYKTPSLRKPINYLIMNMAMSDLIFPLILIPWRLVSLNTSPAGHWLIGGPLGQALCKLVVYLPMVSYSVSSQSLVLIAVDRFVALKLQAYPGEQSNNAEKKRARRNRKVLRMACAIVLAFSLSYVPVLTTGIIMSLFPKIMSSCGFSIFLIFTIFMSHVNCAVNPIICLIFSSNYRQCLKRLLKC